MKNLLFSFFLMISIKSAAQFTFDKSILDCEDKWVVFPEEYGGIYKYGFIYVDSETGLTFDYSGSLKINDAGKITAFPKELGSSIKIPLNPNKIQIALIPEVNYEQLKISQIPDWLSSHKMKEGSIEQLYRWGSIYNTWGKYQKAVELLEKAAKINNEYKGLDIQLAYSYNRLNQYKKAIEVLKKALTVNPSDAFIHKEYIYALAKSQQFEAAIISYRNSLKVCPDTTYVPENAYYILEGYFYKYDWMHFDKWLAETEEVMSTNEQIKKIIAEMKIEISKNRL
ncbi:tetratricopeptide repeat protein [Flavobacterium aestuarii]|uniref:tetratricopeptide repeat protein n=1 Tax=Flavobacterium aestuarii TaxID=3149227 RepID=UPI0032B610E8